MSDRLIVGIVGFIGSGKDTVANYLQHEHDFCRNSFASSLKDSLSAIFGWDRILLEGLTAESRKWREQVDPWWASRLGIENFTPRYAMQNFGTNLCRDNFHKDIWVASLEKKLSNTTTDIVVSDCRFTNEISMLKKYNAKIIWVCRHPLPKWYTELCVELMHPKSPESRVRELANMGIHASEVEWVGMDYDYTVYNNGSLSDLREKVKNLVQSLRGTT